MDTIIAKKKGEGVDAYGLFVNYIWFNTEDGTLMREERRFLVRNLVCFYSRPKGDKRSTWKVAKFDTHDGAREALLSNLDREIANVGSEIFGQPLIIELTAADIAAVEKFEAPYARHAGSVALERALGKIDDDEWRASPFR